MESQTQNVVCVCRVELLRVCLPVVDDAQRGNVVDDTTILSVVEIVATVVATVSAEERREESYMYVVSFWIV